jgi:hypothetical protein
VTVGIGADIWAQARAAPARMTNEVFMFAVEALSCRVGLVCCRRSGKMQPAMVLWCCGVVDE